MALGIFRHWSLADLTTLRTAATTAMLAGANRFRMRNSSGDVSAEYEFAIDTLTFWDELNAAIDLLDPDADVLAKRTTPRYL